MRTRRPRLSPAVRPRQEAAKAYPIHVFLSQGLRMQEGIVSRHRRPSLAGYKLVQPFQHFIIDKVRVFTKIIIISTRMKFEIYFVSLTDDTTIKLSIY